MNVEDLFAAMLSVLFGIVVLGAFAFGVIVTSRFAWWAIKTAWLLWLW